MYSSFMSVAILSYCKNILLGRDDVIAGKEYHESEWC